MMTTTRDVDDGCVGVVSIYCYSTHHILIANITQAMFVYQRMTDPVIALGVDVVY